MIRSLTFLILPILLLAGCDKPVDSISGADDSETVAASPTVDQPTEYERLCNEFDRATAELERLEMRLEKVTQKESFRLSRREAFIQESLKRRNAKYEAGLEDEIKKARDLPQSEVDKIAKAYNERITNEQLDEDSDSFDSFADEAKPLKKEYYLLKSQITEQNDWVNELKERINKLR